MPLSRVRSSLTLSLSLSCSPSLFLTLTLSRAHASCPLGSSRSSVTVRWSGWQVAAATSFLPTRPIVAPPPPSTKQLPFHRQQIIVVFTPVLFDRTFFFRFLSLPSFSFLFSLHTHTPTRTLNLSHHLHTMAVIVFAVAQGRRPSHARHTL